MDVDVAFFFEEHGVLPDLFLLSSVSELKRTERYFERNNNLIFKHCYRGIINTFLRATPSYCNEWEEDSAKLSTHIR